MVDLRDVIDVYEKENFDDPYQNCKTAILVCFEGGADGRGFGALGNEYALMTFNPESFRFYFVSNMQMRIPKHTDILDYMDLPYENIIGLRVGRQVLLWRNLKIRFLDESGNKLKIKLVMSTTTPWVKNQKENIETLINFIEAEGLVK